MALNKNQFKDLIERCLKKTMMHSDAAVALLLGTAAQESAFGTYIRQIGGPALGVFQMEPATERDTWQNYLTFRIKLQEVIFEACGVTQADPWALETNLAYQVIMARIHYRRVSEPLPAADDIPALARYWKQNYNTPEGRGTELEFLSNFYRFIGGKPP